MPRAARTLSSWARTMAGASARPASSARRLILAADVALSGEEGVDVALREQARVARQRVFEAGQRQPGMDCGFKIEALPNAVKDARGEGIAGADPVDDPGDDDFLGLRR